MINLTKSQKNGRLPTVALGFCIAPPIFLGIAGIPYCGYVFGFLILASVWGLGFQVIGLLLGIISLFNRKRYPGKMNLVFSIASILIPLLWFGYIYYLHNYTNVEMHL